VARRILVVDDDHSTRVGLVALLESAGYEVIPAATLKAARKSLVDDAPDLVITDVRLGEFNGLHIAAANRTQVPVIVITGFPDPVLEAVARTFGAEFLLKPLRPADLLALVERKLSAPADDVTFHPSRRWPRKRLTSELEAQVDTLPVRVVDVSYGGLSLAARSAPPEWLPAAFRITFPAASLSLQAHVVWERSNDASWTCGVMVADDAQAQWHQFVDAMS
jgi:FixJ family two-component response regulator